MLRGESTIAGSVFQHGSQFIYCNLVFVSCFVFLLPVVDESKGSGYGLGIVGRGKRLHNHTCCHYLYLYNIIFSALEQEREQAMTTNGSNCTGHF